ncbi:MAG: phosphodiester glycosidase family protein [Victivallales bacterium]|nr:phosphodiester glycosidase family protein [Victivallales bacterium]
MFGRKQGVGRKQRGILIVATTLLLAGGWSYAAGGTSLKPAGKEKSAAMAGAAETKVSEEKIADGVTRERWQVMLFGDQLQDINVLRIHRNDGTYRFVLCGGTIKRVKTSEMCRNRGAIAGINGGFFQPKTGEVVGYLKIDGKTVKNFGRRGWESKPVENAAIVTDKNGVVRVEPARDDDEYDKDADAYGVLVTGPMLIHQGQPIYQPPHPRHPRTAIGTNADGEVLLVTVDGRQSEAVGVSFAGLQQIMSRLGCVEAMNMDGGGSTTMWVDKDGGKICNHPSDKQGERAVINQLLLLPAAKH